MPRIKRWFPVNHDINGDPEVWELTDRHGDRALRVWLEILSVTDRNEGEFKGEQEYIVRALSSKCRTNSAKVLSVLEYAKSKEWLLPDWPLRTRNHAKYHRTEEHNKFPQGNVSGSPPSKTSKTSETNSPKPPETGGEDGASRFPKNRREFGTNPRAIGSSPRQLGENPRAVNARFKSRGTSLIICEECGRECYGEQEYEDHFHEQHVLKRGQP